MTKHTPTPFKVKKYSTGEVFIEGADDTRVCRIIKQYTATEAKANQDFIELACNSHDDLVEALKGAKAIIYECRLFGLAQGSEFTTRILKIEEALRKAGAA